MNLDLIRNKVKKSFNKELYFVYKGSRGQIERFRGFIVEMYPRIFIVKTNNGFIKSFSYSDFAIGNIRFN